TSAVDRILTDDEWTWITGNLVFLRREHPRFLAAASWYRKGLIGRDNLDDFCCYWRVVERLAYSFADRSNWKDEEKNGGRDWPVKQYLVQIVRDLFSDGSAPEILSDPSIVTKIKRLRDDLSHGNIPITLEVIDDATSYLKPLEDAAFKVLHGIRSQKLACPEPT
ncbi:MAG: hypothetical protein ACOVQM_16255, partial [Pirellula sp.]